MKALFRLLPPQLPLDGLELVLRPDRPLPLRGAQGYRLRCLEGCAWITLPGEWQDIFLRPGEDWRVAGPGRVLLEGLGRTVVTVGR